MILNTLHEIKLETHTNYIDYHVTLLLHPISPSGHFVSAWEHFDSKANIKIMRSDVECNIMIAMSWFLYHMLTENITQHNYELSY